MALLEPSLSHHPFVPHSYVALAHQAKLSNVIMLPIEDVMMLSRALIMGRYVMCQRRSPISDGH